MELKDALKELESKIGKELHVGSWFTITQERIDQFAETTCDFQWIHVEPERAEKESPFGSTIAHGYLTLSLIPFLTESIHPGKPSITGAKRLINYGSNKVRFPSAVKPGARIRTRSVLASVKEVKGSLEIVKKITVEIEGSEKPACVTETVTRAYF